MVVMESYLLKVKFPEPSGWATLNRNTKYVLVHLDDEAGEGRGCAKD